MKIRIATYKEGVPELLQYTCEADALDIQFDDMKFLSPVLVEGTVDLEEKSLRFSGQVSAKVLRICGRTLAEVKELWSAKFDWFFETENREYVEPDDQLRELIILEHPMVFRAPGADKPAEYTDVEKKKKSPFEELKRLKEQASGSDLPRGNKKGLGSVQQRKDKKK